MAKQHYSFQEALLLCMPVIDTRYSSYQAEVENADPAPHGLQGVQSSSSSAKKSGSEQNSVTCTKGCGTCCHYGLISSSSLEAFGLFARLIGSGVKLEELAATCGAYVKRFKELTQSGGLVGHLPFSRKARLAFIKARLPCPFFVATPKANEPADSAMGSALGAYSGHCGVYALRPLICSQFNSTESPLKCLKIEKHQTKESQIKAGVTAAEDLRIFEQHNFGKSALGHLPLLVAAMTTHQGLQAFLRKDPRPEDTEENPHAAGTADFFFYVELLDAIGIQLSDQDYLDLERAQAEP